MSKPTTPAEDLNEIICRIAIFGRSTIQFMERASAAAAGAHAEAEALRTQLEDARNGECCRVAKRDRDAAQEQVQALKQQVATLEAMILRLRNDGTGS